MSTIERFFSPFLPSDLKTEAKDNSPGTLSGYVTKWNTLSHDRGGYRVVFRPDAFANLADESSDIRALRDHEEGIYLGRTSNNSLCLSTDQIGLRFSLDLPDTQDGRDTAVLARRGDFGGMSFGYLPDRFGWKNEQQGPILEHLSGHLVEVSVVFSPAFPRTSVELNALDEPNPEVLESLKQFLGTPRKNIAEKKLWLAEKLILSA